MDGYNGDDLDKLLAEADDYLGNPKRPKRDVSALLDRIEPSLITQESSGKPNARNSRTGARGLYQVVPANIPVWTKQYVGRSMSPDEFENDVEAQRKVFRGEFGRYLRKALSEGYDEDTAIRRAAAGWYGGERRMSRYDDPKRSRRNEPSFREYTTKILGRIKRNAPVVTDDLDSLMREADTFLQEPVQPQTKFDKQGNPVTAIGGEERVASEVVPQPVDEPAPAQYSPYALGKAQEALQKLAPAPQTPDNPAYLDYLKQSGMTDSNESRKAYNDALTNAPDAFRQPDPPQQQIRQPQLSVPNGLKPPPPRTQAQSGMVEPIRFTSDFANRRPNETFQQFFDREMLSRLRGRIPGATDYDIQRALDDSPTLDTEGQPLRESRYAGKTAGALEFEIKTDVLNRIEASVKRREAETRAKSRIDAGESDLDVLLDEQLISPESYTTAQYERQVEADNEKAAREKFLADNPTSDLTDPNFLSGVGAARFGDGSQLSSKVREQRPDTERLDDILRKYGSAQEYYKAQERIKEEYKYRPLAEPLEFAGNLARSVAAMPAYAGQFGVIALTDLNPWLKGVTAEQNPVYQALGGYRQWLEDQRNPDLDAWYVRDLPDGLGQLASQALLAPFTGGASVLLPIAQGAVEQYDAATKSNASNTSRNIATIVGGLAAVPEVLLNVRYIGKALPDNQVTQLITGWAEKLFGNLAKVLPEAEARQLTSRTIGAFLQQGVRNGVLGAATEYTQERAEDTVNKLVAKLSYKPEVSWTDVFVPNSDEQRGYLVAGIIGAFGGNVNLAIQKMSTSELQKSDEVIAKALREGRISQENAETLAREVADEAKRRNVNLSPTGTVEQLVKNATDRFFAEKEASRNKVASGVFQTLQPITAPATAETEQQTVATPETALAETIEPQTATVEPMVEPSIPTDVIAERPREMGLNVTPKAQVRTAPVAETPETVAETLVDEAKAQIEETDVPPAETSPESQETATARVVAPNGVSITLPENPLMAGRVRKELDLARQDGSLRDRILSGEFVGKETTDIEPRFDRRKFNRMTSLAEQKAYENRPSRTEFSLRRSDGTGIVISKMLYDALTFAPVQAQEAQDSKKPWQMTNGEFAERMGFNVAGLVDDEGRSVKHYDSIEKALQDGKPVPAEVLAEYPDLAEKYAAKTNEQTRAVRNTFTVPYDDAELKRVFRFKAEIAQIKGLFTSNNVRRLQQLIADYEQRIANLKTDMASGYAKSSDADWLRIAEEAVNTAKTRVAFDEAVKTDADVDAVPLSQRIDPEDLGDGSTFTRAKVAASVNTQKPSPKTGMTKTQTEWFVEELHKAFDAFESGQQQPVNFVLSTSYRGQVPLASPEQNRDLRENGYIIDVPGDGTFRFATIDGVDRIHKKLTGKTVQEFREAQDKTLRPSVGTTYEDEYRRGTSVTRGTPSKQRRDDLSLEQEYQNEYERVYGELPVEFDIETSKDREELGKRVASLKKLPDATRSDDTETEAQIDELVAPTAETPSESQETQEPWEMTRDEYGATLARSEPNVTQLTKRETTVLQTVGLNGPKSIRVARYDLPKYNGVPLYVQEYKASNKQTGYRIYLPTGNMLEDSNGVTDLPTTMRRAVQRISLQMQKAQVSHPKELTRLYEINNALQSGKPVPPEVLADYPDLAKKYAAKTTNERTQDVETGKQNRAESLADFYKWNSDWQSRAQQIQSQYDKTKSVKKRAELKPQADALTAERNEKTAQAMKQWRKWYAEAQSNNDLMTAHSVLRWVARNAPDEDSNISAVLDNLDGERFGDVGNILRDIATNPKVSDELRQRADAMDLARFEPEGDVDVSKPVAEMTDAELRDANRIATQTNNRDLARATFDERTRRDIAQRSRYTPKPDDTLKSVSSIEDWDSAAYDRELESITLERNKDGKILAPNGKVSNIQNERLAKVVRSKAFKDWFGDWEAESIGKQIAEPFSVSQVKDENGEPLVVYHGSPQGDFEVFRSEQYFSPDPNYASRYTSGSGAALSGGIKSESSPAMFTGFLRLKRVFDPRNDRDKRIWDTQFFRKFGNGTPLSEDGLPDWTDGRDLAEFLQEEVSTPYDGMMIDEGGDALGRRPASFVVFDPKNIKSIFNRGSFSSEDASILKSVSAPVSEVGFYSAVDQAILDKMPNKAGVDQVRSILNPQKSPVKQEEIDWLGLDEFLSDKQSVTKQELLDFVRANNVEIEEVVKGQLDTKFSDYRLEGDKENYRELLLTLHGQLTTDTPIYKTGDDIRARNTAEFRDLTGFTSDGLEAAASFIDETGSLKDALRLQDALIARGWGYTAAQKEAGVILRSILTNQRKRDERVFAKFNYKSPHFDEPNILAHVRFNERTDADGKRVLFVEEIQSDWHQAGRKKGYKTDFNDSELEQVRRELAPIQAEIDANVERFYADEIDHDTFSANARRLQDQARDLKERVRTLEDAQRNAVPDAPFKKSWHELAMKRILRYAAENGFDKVAWTTGEQQNDRYDLSKKVDYIDAVYSLGYANEVTIVLPNTTLILTLNKDGIVTDVLNTEGGALPAEMEGRPLDEIIGKDVATRILEYRPDPTARAEQLESLFAREKAAYRDDNDELAKELYEQRQALMAETPLAKRFEGNDLKLGGTGMKGFYDKIIPSFVNKYAKKWGAKVGTTSFDTGDYKVMRDSFDPPYRLERRNSTDIISRHATAEEAWNEAERLGATIVHAVDITPSMRESVMAGQPLFAKRDRDRTARLNETLPYETELHKVVENIESKFDDNGELELNEYASETIRRVLAEMSNDPYETSFDGVTIPQATARKIANRIRGRIKAMDKAGYDVAPITQLVENLDKLATAKPFGIVYVFDDVLPEERVHVEDLTLGRTDSKAIAELKRSPIWATAQSGRFSKEYGNQSEANQISEIAAKLATDQSAKYGWTNIDNFEAEKTKFLNTWADGVLRGNESTIEEIGVEAFIASYPTIGKYGKVTTGDTKGTRNQRTSASADETRTAKEDDSEKQTQADERSDRDTEAAQSDTDRRLPADGKLKKRQFAVSMAEQLFDIGDVEYEAQTEKGWSEKAIAKVEELGTDKAIDEYRKLPANESAGNKTALGIGIAIDLYQKGDFKQLTDFGRELTENIGNAAQELRAAALLSRLSPVFAEAYAERIVRRNLKRAATEEEKTAARVLAEKLADLSNKVEITQAALEQQTAISKDFEDAAKEIEQMLADERGKVADEKRKNRNLTAALKRAKDAAQRIKTPRTRTPAQNKALRKQIEAEKASLMDIIKRSLPGNVLKSVTGPSNGSLKSVSSSLDPLARDLIVVHNLTESNLVFSDRLGGIAMPSMAITKPQTGFKSFGEITLIGTPAMATPSRLNPITDADMYSPRYPRQQIFVDADRLADAWTDVANIYNTFYPDQSRASDEIPSAYGIRESLKDEGLDALRYNRSFIIYALANAGIITRPITPDEYWSVTDDTDAIVDQAAQDFVERLNPQYKFFKGYSNLGNRRYSAYDLATVLREMKSQMREGEGFNYGAGSVRAATATRFKSLKEIQANRNRITPNDERLESLKDEANTELTKLADQYAEFYTHDRNRFGYYDTFANVLVDGIRQRNLRRAFEEYGFENITDWTPINNYLTKLRNLPTEYFEAKPQRIVRLHEFAAAVVPSNLSERAKRILQRNGLSIAEYTPGDNTSRAKAVANISNDNGLLFSKTSSLDPQLRDAYVKLSAAKMIDEFGKPLVDAQGNKQNDPFTLAKFDEWLDGLAQQSLLPDDRAEIHAMAYDMIRPQRQTIGMDASQRTRNRMEHAKAARKIIPDQQADAIKDREAYRRDKFAQAMVETARDMGATPEETYMAFGIRELGDKRRLEPEFKREFPDANFDKTLLAGENIYKETKARLDRARIEMREGRKLSDKELFDIKHADKLNRGAAYNARRNLERYYRELAKSTGRKAADRAFDVLGLPKTLMSTGEVSFALRQGFIPFLLFNKEWREGTKGIVKGMSDPTKRIAYEQELRDDPYFTMAEHYGVAFNQIGNRARIDEHFPTKFIENLANADTKDRNIAAVGAIKAARLQQRFEHAYTLPGDAMRLGLFKNLAQVAEQSITDDPAKLEQAYKYAAYIANISVGKGSVEKVFGTDAMFTRFLNTIGFAPGYLMSRIEAGFHYSPLGIAVAYSRGGAGMAKQMARKSMRMYGSLAGAAILMQGLIAGVSGAGDGDKEPWYTIIDPSSPNFMKLRWPNGIKTDITANLSDWGKLFLPNFMASGWHAVQEAAGNDEAGFEKAVDVWGKDWNKFFGSWRYWRGKLSPTASAAAELYDGKTYLGRPITPWGMITSRTAPLTYQQAYDAFFYDPAEQFMREPETFKRGVDRLMDLNNESLSGMGKRAANSLTLFGLAGIGIGAQQYERFERSPAEEKAASIYGEIAGGGKSGRKSDEQRRIEAGLRDLFRYRDQLADKGKDTQWVTDAIKRYAQKYNVPADVRTELKDQAQTSSLKFYTQRMTAAQVREVLKYATFEEQSELLDIIKKKESNEEKRKAKGAK